MTLKVLGQILREAKIARANWIEAQPHKRCQSTHSKQASVFQARDLHSTVQQSYQLAVGAAPRDEALAANGEAPLCFLRIDKVPSLVDGLA